MDIIVVCKLARETCLTWYWQDVHSPKFANDNILNGLCDVVDEQMGPKAMVE